MTLFWFIPNKLQLKKELAKFCQKYYLNLKLEMEDETNVEIKRFGLWADNERKKGIQQTISFEYIKF